MRWILDDGPFGELAEVSGRSDRCDLSSYTTSHILIPSATANSARSSTYRRGLLELYRSDGKRLVEVFEVLIGGDDPAERVLQDLHGEERTQTDLAEREAIAWALVHGKDAVFVTADKRATVTALAELGRQRVAHPFDVWLDLLQERAVEAADFRFLCEKSKWRDQGLERMPERVARFF